MELPPRARRILNDVEQFIIDLGTTSACAENTCGALYTPDLSRNYLRVRGEYGLWLVSLIGVRELPPRARRIP